MDLRGDWDYRLDSAGKLWLAYYDQNRLLRLRHPDGKEVLLVPEGRGQAPSGLALAALDQGVAVLWRDKHPAKGLYLLDTSQTNMEPLEIGGDTEPLARFQAIPGPGDLLHLLWYGEKVGEPTGEKHNLYYRQLNRKTQALSPIELLMPGIYPVMATDTAGGVMVYSWLMGNKTQRIEARYRPAKQDANSGADGFGEPVAIADIPEMSTIFKAFQSGSRSFVMWLAQYGEDKRDFLLEGAYSDDQGKTWKRFAFEDLRGIDVASLQIATDQTGHILLALAGRTRNDDAKTKQDIYVIRSADRGDTWSSPTRLRHVMAQEGEQRDREIASLARFNARNPSLAFGQVPGQVLVVWEDWRQIRSGLYASLSSDYGQTWPLSNVPLPGVPGKNLSLRYEPNAVYADGDHFQVIAEQATDDAFVTKQLTPISLTSAQLEEYAKSNQATEQPATQAQEQALRKREEGFWEAMLAGDYTKTYAYQDPFFRARNPLDHYLGSMGRIKYTQAEVVDVHIDGPRADVKTRITASVPEFKAPTTGEMISQPERTVIVESTWLWLDGDWYREFTIESRDIVFTRY